MLTATQGKNIAATQQYFESVLSVGDYYLGQEVPGQWHGRGADILGLGQGSNVRDDQFGNLLHGQHPTSGKSLAQRQRMDRRPGVDLTFSVPKSVSLAWAINDDEQIVKVLREAVHETMKRDVEPLMQRRVREGRHAATKERTQTGKMIYADFLHKTSRPVDGKPDPHLHIHAFVINWTEDKGKHYAGEFEEIIRQRASLQAKFEARLAAKLKNELSYDVRKVRYSQSGRLKSGWEIDGIDRRTIEKFSKRTEQVEIYALEHGITNEAEKAQLGKRTREKKQSGLTIDQLRAEWRSRLSEDERQSFGELRTRTPVRQLVAEADRANEALSHSLEHHLYRQSTVERHQIIGTALEKAVTVLPEQMEQAFERLELVRRTRDVEGAKREVVTTRAVLAAEKGIIGFARDGRGTRKPIGRIDYEFQRSWLNDQQKQAVRHVLTSRDTVMAVMGGAGTGKSSLMEEAADAIRSSGRELFTFAPTTGACEVLQSKGFEQTKTVEHLLQNSKLQSQVRGQVLWIDESGLLDVRAMEGIFRIALEQQARVILSGDTRQHASPRRGAAMQLLEREAGLNIARVETIQRQRGNYREAVALLSRGHEIVDERSRKTGLVAGFDLLDDLDKIQEVPGEERNALLAEKYLQCQIKGKSTLVVAPTHAEAAGVTEAIRDRLKEHGSLPKQEVSVRQLRSLNLTEAEKRDSSCYQGEEGLIIQFHQNVTGKFKKGERYRVSEVIGEDVLVSHEKSGEQRRLPLGSSDRFEVYREATLNFAAGDKIRFSLGGTALNQKQRIANGRLDEIQSINRQGHLQLKSGMTVSRDYGHLDLGYVVTSHSSQGKDKDVVLAAMSSASLAAVNSKQFYVTASRGKEDVMIFVDDKSTVRRSIVRSGEELSATQLVREAEREASQNHDRVRRGGTAQQMFRSAVQTVRDRFVNWWRENVTAQNSRTTQERSPSLNFERTIGGGFSPEYGRT